MFHDNIFQLILLFNSCIKLLLPLLWFSLDSLFICLQGSCFLAMYDACYLYLYNAFSFCILQWFHNKSGRAIVDVVLDPYLCNHLRPHQVKGVTFLYKCVMGMGDFNGNGAILAYVSIIQLFPSLKLPPSNCLSFIGTHTFSNCIFIVS